MSDADDMVRWIKYLTANEVLSGHEPRWRFRLFVWALGLVLCVANIGLTRWLVGVLWMPEWEP